MTKKQLKVLELFGGINATSEGISRLGIEHDTFTVEFDNIVQKVSNALWNRNEPTRDVTKLLDHNYQENILGKEFDLVVAGFPCQPFSIAGKKLGTEDSRGNLYIDTLNVVEYVKPKYVIFENVRNILNDKFKHVVKEIEDQLKEWGYNVSTQVINSKDFSHQERERVFIIGSLEREIKPITGSIEPLNSIADVLDMSLPFDRITNQWFKKNDKYWYKNYEDKREVPQKDWEASYNRIRNPYTNKKFPTLVVGNNTKLGKVVGDELHWRELSPKERMLAMGWTAEQFERVSHLAQTNIFKVTGNSMVVPVMQAIVKELLNI